jgi:hypothetical protein
MIGVGGRPAQRALLAPALALAVLAGCGAHTTALDTLRLERAIAGSILSERHVYALVSCPANVPQQQGRRFTCTARLTVGSYPVPVVEVDGRGHVDYGSRAPLTALDTRRIERSIAASVLARRGLHAVVGCPPEVLQKRGLTFTCQAHVGGRAYPFGVTEIDGDGHVRYVGR